MDTKTFDDVYYPRITGTYTINDDIIAFYFDGNLIQFINTRQPSDSPNRMEFLDLNKTQPYFRMLVKKFEDKVKSREKEKVMINLLDILGVSESVTIQKSGISTSDFTITFTVKDSHNIRIGFKGKAKYEFDMQISKFDVDHIVKAVNNFIKNYFNA